MKWLLFLSVLVLTVPVFEKSAQAGGFFTRGPIRRFLFFGGPIRRRLFARRLARRGFCPRCLPPRLARPPRCGNGLHRGGGCNGRGFRPFAPGFIDPAQNGAGITEGISPVSQLTADERSEFERIFDESQRAQLEDLVGRNWVGQCENSLGVRRNVGPIQFPSQAQEQISNGSLLLETPAQSVRVRFDESSKRVAIQMSPKLQGQDKLVCVLESAR